MEERILDLKTMFDAGINKKMFFALLTNCTNGATDNKSQYSNYLKVVEWIDLFSRPFVEIPVNEEQVGLFFNYMSKYFGYHFGRNQDAYYVNKSFTNAEKTDDR